MKRYHIHATDLDWRARGGPVFDEWRRLVPASMGAKFDRRSKATWRIEFPALLFVSAAMCVPPTGMVGLVERTAARPDGVVVVDIHFPLMRPDACHGQPGTVRFLTHPGYQAAMLRAVEAADAVTVPFAEWDGYPGWIDDIAEHNPNVTVLPDLDGTNESIDAFATNLLRIWDAAAVTKRARLTLRETL
jgi:hypothetical protein